MKLLRISMILLLFGVTGNSRAQLVEDVLHFSGGALAGAAGSYFVSEISDGGRGWRIAGALGASLTAGLIKEAVDANQYGGWNNRDLAFTVLGGVTAGVTIELFRHKKQSVARTWQPRMSF